MGDRAIVPALLAVAVVLSIFAATPAKAAASCFGAEATIVGTNENETLRGTSERDVIVAKDGHDVIVAKDGNDLVCAGAGDDSVSGGAGKDRINGGEEFVGDELLGEGGRDFIQAGGGSFYDFGHGDVVRGGAGPDEIDGTKGLDYLYGGTGADEMRDPGTNDPESGQLMEGGAGSDSLTGGIFFGHNEYDPEAGFVYETLSGGDGDDDIVGGGSSGEFDETVVEHLSGGAGDDTLDGREGQNTNDGGPGTDTCANPDTGEGATNCEN